ALGQPRNNHSGSTSIRDEVHVFEEGPGGYASVALLTNPRAVNADDSFGVELAMDGDLIAVAGDEVLVTSAGTVSAHAFTAAASGWTSRHRFTTASGVSWPL
ncbi:MAG: hypothetical protein AAGG01_10330, partial [Planctomycetota bacterium]